MFIFLRDKISAFCDVEYHFMPLEIVLAGYLL